MAEQVGLVAKCRHVRQAVPTVSQHDGHVDEHPARVMAAAAPTDRCHGARERIGQPSGVGHLGHEQAAGVPGTPVPSAVTLRCGRPLLRFALEVPSWIGTDGLSTFSFPYQEGVFADYCTAKPDANETCGLDGPLVLSVSPAATRGVSFGPALTEAGFGRRRTWLTSEGRVAAGRADQWACRIAPLHRAFSRAGHTGMSVRFRRSSR